MVQSQFVLYAIKIFLGAITVFCGILIWGKTRNSAWLILLSGFIIHYAGTIYKILLELNFIVNQISIFGLPLMPLIFAVVPQVLFIIAFILILIRNEF